GMSLLLVRAVVVRGYWRAGFSPDDTGPRVMDVAERMATSVRCVTRAGVYAAFRAVFTAFESFHERQTSARLASIEHLRFVSPTARNAHGSGVRRFQTGQPLHEAERRHPRASGYRHDGGLRHVGGRASVGFRSGRGFGAARDCRRRTPGRRPHAGTG